MENVVVLIIEYNALRCCAILPKGVPKRDVGVYKRMILYNIKDEGTPLGDVLITARSVTLGFGLLGSKEVLILRGCF
jgi:hypothetical protein